MHVMVIVHHLSSSQYPDLSSRALTRDPESGDWLALIFRFLGSRFRGNDNACALFELFQQAPMVAITGGQNAIKGLGQI